MFAKELRRGQRQASKPQISTATRTSFCFDGHELTLNYLTYQMCDLTYPPLAQIVNNPSNVKPFVTERDGWFVEGTIRRLRDVMKRRWFELIKSADLSSLSPEKLEEILQVVAPQTGKLALPGNINQIISQMESIEAEDDEIEVDEGEEEEDSDYEIFD